MTTLARMHHRVQDIYLDFFMMKQSLMNSKSRNLEYKQLTDDALNQLNELISRILQLEHTLSGLMR